MSNYISYIKDNDTSYPIASTSEIVYHIINRSGELVFDEPNPPLTDSNLSIKVCFGGPTTSNPEITINNTRYLIRSVFNFNAPNLISGIIYDCNFVDATIEGELKHFMLIEDIDQSLNADSPNAVSNSAVTSSINTLSTSVSTLGGNVSNLTTSVDTLNSKITHCNDVIRCTVTHDDDNNYYLNATIDNFEFHEQKLITISINSAIELSDIYDTYQVYLKINDVLYEFSGLSPVKFDYYEKDYFENRLNKITRIFLLTSETFTLKFWTTNNVNKVIPISGNLIQVSDVGNINSSQPNTDIKVTVDANYSSKYIVNMPKAVVELMGPSDYFYVPIYGNRVRFTTAILNSTNGSSIVPLNNENVGRVPDFSISLPASSMGANDMVTIYSVSL